MSFTVDEIRSARTASLIAGSHHARYIDANVPMHVISRVFQGRHLLRPCAELNTIIVGVVGRALERFAEVRLYAAAFLSNHLHLMLQGPPTQVSAFIGFIKREISRRWGHHPKVGWHGPMWHEYVATALPTPESEVHCLKYVLAQGVKEGLVASPEDWPGVHCARALATDSPLKGTWLNATDYGRAVDREARKVCPQVIAKEDFVVGYDVKFAPIPSWTHLDDSSRRRQIKRLIAEIITEGDVSRAGAPPLGAGRIRCVPLEHRTTLPPPPWWTRRRRMICWASPSAAATRRFLRAYWNFQERFREASVEDAYQRGANYPPGAYAPGRWTTDCPGPTALSA